MGQSPTKKESEGEAETDHQPAWRRGRQLPSSCGELATVDSIMEQHPELGGLLLNPKFYPKHRRMARRQRIRGQQDQDDGRFSMATSPGLSLRITVSMATMIVMSAAALGRGGPLACSTAVYRGTPSTD